jgi:hypothetical protein
MEHTLEHPYCDNPDCWCHNKDNYHLSFTTDLLWIEPDQQNVTTAIEVLGEHSTDWQVAA